jgi:hypothetical protein
MDWTPWTFMRSKSAHNFPAVAGGVDSNNAFKAAILSSVKTVMGGYSGRHSNEATSSATLKHTVVTKMR